MNRRTTVFYLLRHTNHPRWFSHFIRSIDSHRAGAPFDLVVLAKGGIPSSVLTYLRRLQLAPPADVQSIRCHMLSDEGYDLHAYFKGASFANTPRVLFFNSYTRVLGDFWLAIYERAFNSLPHQSLIGATGSFEAINKSPIFPNPHVRTNAIMLSRDFYLSLAPPPMTKAGCQNFEAGYSGLTRQVLEAGGYCGIVTRSGRLISPSNWPETPIFRVDQQQELLVADNRTHDYEIASFEKKKKLAMKAWGCNAQTSPTLFRDRIRRWYLWHRPDLGICRHD